MIEYWKQFQTKGMVQVKVCAYNLLLFLMQLHLLINGQKCEVKFQKHHTFQRVLNLLKQNKLIPSGVSFDKVDIIGKDGTHYTRTNHVIESLIPPETSKCQVKIKFSSIAVEESNINSNKESIYQNKESAMEVPGAKKARLVDIVKGFFQKMEKHEFKKLQKYENHHEEIISQVARFASTYEKLYAQNLYYKSKVMKLNEKQEHQLQEYREKFLEFYKVIERESYQSLHVIIKNDSIFQMEASRIQIQARESIEEKQKMIDQLQIELEKLKQTHEKEKKELQDQIIEWKLKYDCSLKSNTIDGLRQQIIQLKQSLQYNEMQAQQKQEEIDNLNSAYIDLKQELIMVKEQLNKAFLEIKSLKKELEQMRISKNNLVNLLKSKNDLIQQLSQKANIQVQRQKELEEEIVKLKQILEQTTMLKAENQSLTQKLAELMIEFSKIKQQNNQINKAPKMHKLAFLTLKQQKSSKCFEEMIQQPVSCLKLCLSPVLAQQFISKLNLYLNKTLKNLTRFIYHPNTLKIQSSKILKQLKGRKNILLICVTQQNRIVGGYSTLPIDSFCNEEELRQSKAFLFNIQQGQVNLFEIKQGRIPVKYDEDFFILGEQEITIDYQTLTLSSRFVNLISQEYTSFKDPKKRRKYLLNPHQKNKVKLKEYWLFHCTLE